MYHLFRSYGEIDDINLEENDVKMMGPYNPAEPLACLLEHLDKWLELLCDRGQTITDVMVVSKVINLLVQTMTFNDYICQWIQQPSNLNTWVAFKVFFRRIHWG